jgi:hypothetical protein
MSALNRAEVVQVLLEFLEGAIHTAVRARNIYNPEVFERQKLYNIFIGKSRNPQLNEYIASVVHNCRVSLTWGAQTALAAHACRPARPTRIAPATRLPRASSSRARYRRWPWCSRAPAASPWSASRCA